MSENQEWAFVSAALPQVDSGALSEDSDITERDVPLHLECVSCQGRHRVTIAFKECISTHASCTRCLIGLFRAKWEHTLHSQYLPTKVTCPLCRAEIEHIGVLSVGPIEGGQSVIVGGKIFIGLQWVPLLKWIVNEEDDIRLALEIYHLAKKYHLEIKKVGNRWVIPGQQPSTPALSVGEITLLMAMYQSDGLAGQT